MSKPNYFLEVVGLMFLVLVIPLIMTFIYYPNADSFIKVAVWCLFFIVEMVALQINEDLNGLKKNS